MTLVTITDIVGARTRSAQNSNVRLYALGTDYQSRSVLCFHELHGVTRYSVDAIRAKLKQALAHPHLFDWAIEKTDPTEVDRSIIHEFSCQYFSWPYVTDKKYLRLPEER